MLPPLSTIWVLKVPCYIASFSLECGIITLIFKRFNRKVKNKSWSYKLKVKNKAYTKYPILFLHMETATNDDLDVLLLMYWTFRLQSSTCYCNICSWNLPVICTYPQRAALDLELKNFFPLCSLLCLQVHNA